MAFTRGNNVAAITVGIRWYRCRYHCIWSTKIQHQNARKKH